MDFKLADIKEFKTLREMVKMAADEDRDTVAYKFRDGKEIKSVTYGRLYELISYLGTSLKSYNMDKVHIGIIGENSFDWILTYLTALLSDGVCVPVDKELPINDIINVVNHSDTEILFYSKKFEDRFKENRDKFPNVKYFVGFGREEDEGEFLSFKKLIEKGEELYKEDKSFDDEVSPDNDLKLLIYTSGTTGKSKGVMLSQHNIVNGVLYGLRVSQPGRVGLSVLPYHHTYEAVCGLLVGIHYRVTLCINSSLKMILKNLNDFKPDYIYLVPAIVEVFYKRIWATAEKENKAGALRKLIKFSDFLRKLGIDKRKTLFKSVTKAFGGNLNRMVCGGAPLRAEVGNFFDSIGVTIINGYGITECSPLVSATQVEENDLRTVGRCLPCLEVKFDNMTESGDGEIVVKGDVVMLGYYKEPELNKEVLKDGWFYTGDYGRFNDKGLLVITGRKKNLIVLSNGKNVFPEEIEEYIQAIPYVKEVVVYSEKDENGLENSLVAEVFMDEEQTEGMENPEGKLKEDIRKALEELPSYKKISKVVVRKEEFQKTTTNKIKRNTITANS